MRNPASVCLFVLCIVCGCRSDGPELVRTTGTVQLNGKPLSGATVMMISDHFGLLSTGFTDRDGKFEMTTVGRPGVPVGAVKVGVTKSPPEAAEKTAKPPTPDEMRTMQKAAGGKTSDKSKSEVPLKYADPQKSQLTAVIDRKSSKNVLQFSLAD